MPRRKYKLTGFARFFIVMLFLAPIAYLAASYINGEDGISNIREFFGQEQTNNTTTTTVEPGSDEQQEPATGLNAMDRKELESTIYDLRDSLRAKDLEIYELRRQVRLLEGSSE
jgi:hypothetical protein